MRVGVSGMVSVGGRSYAHFFHCFFYRAQIIAVYYLLAVVKNYSWHNIALKILFPFLKKQVVFLNIPCFKRDAEIGEIPFRLDAVTSAICNVYYDTLL